MLEGQTKLASKDEAKMVERFLKVTGTSSTRTHTPTSRPAPLSSSLSITAQLKAAIMLLTMFSCPHISASLAALIVPLIGENKGGWLALIVNSEQSRAVHVSEPLAREK